MNFFMLDTTAQIQTLIDKSNRPLIAFRRDWNGDALASSLALAMLMKKMGKAPTIVCDGFECPREYQFLQNENIPLVCPALESAGKMIVSLELGDNAMEDVRYEVRDGKLNIHLFPKKSILNPASLKAEPMRYAYDLIFTVNTPDLESLGVIYKNHPDFFYTTPIVNIDHHSGNEEYGQVNLVRVVASSAAEIIFELIERLGEEFLDEHMATCLLTGLVTKTKSFHASRVSPKTLNIAGRLIAAGGKREDIVKNLYHNKSLGTLRLWGRVLARLKTNPELKLVWSTLSEQDFIAVGEDDKRVTDVMSELIAHSPEAEIVILIHEKKSGEICVHAFSQTPMNMLELCHDFEPEGSKDMAQCILHGKNLVEAEREVIETLIKKLKQ